MPSCGKIWGKAPGLPYVNFAGGGYRDLHSGKAPGYSCFLLVGALARLEHFLEAGIGCVLGLRGAGFLVFEDWF